MTKIKYHFRPLFNFVSYFFLELSIILLNLINYTSISSDNEKLLVFVPL